MMDRGQIQDWFTSTEVIAEAVAGGLGVYLFIVHMATAKEPFIPIALFKDRNFATGLALMFVAGTILVSSSSLMAPWLQNLANYPVDAAGLIMAPRGIGTMMAMMSGGRLVGRLDPRKVMAVGILMLAWSTWEMTSWTPDISQATIVATIMVQGAGIGFAFLPLQVLAFATLSPQYRTDGASLFSLLRNIGAAVGVSATSALLVHNSQVLHESIGASVTPFNRALQGGGMIGRAWNPMYPHGAAMIDQVVNQQAQITAYIDDYWVMTLTTLPALGLLLLLRRPSVSSSAPADAHPATE
jgi:MFS transporter, DHA2 family, multidrug resistance protein